MNEKFYILSNYCHIVLFIYWTRFSNLSVWSPICKDFNLKPGCPNLIERIESGLLSYGNDFDNNDNPFECGFEKYINLDSEIHFLGKEKLKKIQKEGIKRKLMGVQLEID